MFEIIYSIANYTNHNVKYDLDTLTAEAIQKSSWVYKNKRGVCDEITNLFISLLRSINIPAKFIAGTVYSNVFNGWGNHGWAEVYIPGYGWLPFDVTLGQYGWIDPSHVKLSESIDSARPTVNYKWTSSGVRVNPSKLNIETRLKSVNGQIPQQIAIDIKPLAEKVGFNSYIPLKVTVTNLMNYYLIPKIYLIKSPKTTTSPEAVLFLKPKEKRTFFWLLKLPKALNVDYRYTSPIEARTSFGSADDSKISISSAYKTLTQTQALSKINPILARELKNPFPNLIISCFPESPYYYADSNINVKCLLENKGSPRELSLCIQGVCDDIFVPEKLETNLKTLVKPEIEILIEDDNYIKYADIKPEIIKAPDVFISEISPLNMNYNEEIELKFTISTNHPAKNVKLYLNNKNIYETALLENFKNLKIKVNSKILVSGAKFKVEYQDEKGKSYTRTKKYLTTVANTPFFAKLLSILNMI